jgi:hypothetical protein
MHRFLTDKLLAWKVRSTRHPLVLRGARQVGKTYLARELGRIAFSHYIEVNFEESPALSSLFQTKNPDTICELLTTKYSTPVIDGETLLFLDEIQAAQPYVFESLRYFYEKRPGLHVIAAGSLLEFMLNRNDGQGQNRFPMPVGRIEYMYVPPLDYEEFLEATGHSGLVNFLHAYSLGDELPEALHLEFLLCLKRYLALGGMPAVINAYLSEDILQTEREQQILISNYYHDFPKYGRHASPDLLQKVFVSVPSLLGHKLMYSQIDNTVKSRDLAKAFDCLQQARIVAKVCHTPGNGIPIGFGSDENVFKPLFLDVGLACRLLSLNLADFDVDENALLENRGELCEQFIGQHLLYSGHEFEEPRAYFWMRDARNASAEVDYIIQMDNEVVPVEVKSGKTGSLKGLHFFLNEKHRNFAVRFNGDRPSLLKNSIVKDTLGRDCRFSLLSLPLYMVCQLKRLLREWKRL